MTDDERHERLRAAGGNAFPTHGYGAGMTLRDWFAGQLIAGYLAADATAEHAVPGPDSVAKSAYLIADAMIAARNAEQP